MVVCATSEIAFLLIKLCQCLMHLFFTKPSFNLSERIGMTTVLFFVVLVLIISKIVLKIFSPMYNGVECLVGKVAVVTGGNKGIGLEISKCLLSRGCKVIIGCRNSTAAEAKRLIELTHNENLFIKYLDLQSFESVRNFAKEIYETENKIDILINNAGVGAALGKTVDELNPLMQTNTISPFLLTHLLVDLLKKSDDGRIIFVSSIMALCANLKPEHLTLNGTNQKQSPLDHILSYGRSKLATAIFSRELSEKLKKYSIKVNSIHPGMVYTNIWISLDIETSVKEIFKAPLKWIFYLYLYCYSRTPFEGAQEIVALAVSNLYKNITGQFYYGLSMVNTYPDPLPFYERTLSSELWKTLESIVKIKPNEKL